MGEPAVETGLIFHCPSHGFAFYQGASQGFVLSSTYEIIQTAAAIGCFWFGSLLGCFVRS